LIAFGEISGLRSNVRKTSLMLVGTGGAVPNDLTDLGFTVAQSINTLGFEIRHDLHNLTECFDKAAVKMRNIANFWTRFRLTLPGRIAIA